MEHFLEKKSQSMMEKNTTLQPTNPPPPPLPLAMLKHAAWTLSHDCNIDKGRGEK